MHTSTVHSRSALLPDPPLQGCRKPGESLLSQMGVWPWEEIESYSNSYIKHNLSTVIKSQLGPGH